METVILTVLGSIVVAAISGLALVRSSRSNTTAELTATLVAGQAAAITRLEGQVAARDSTIDDLRSDCDACEQKHRALKVEFERQSIELAAAHESLRQQGKEIARLKARVTEIGDERLP